MTQFICGRLKQERWDMSLQFEEIFEKRFYSCLAANDLITIDENELRSHFEGCNDLVIPIKDLSNDEKIIVHDVAEIANFRANWKNPIVSIDFKKFSIKPCWANMNQIDEMFYRFEYGLSKRIEMCCMDKNETVIDSFFVETKDDALIKAKELFDKGYDVYINNVEVALWVRK